VATLRSSPAAYQLIITGGLPLVIGTGVNDNRGGAFNTFYAADDLSITKGKHLLRFGMDASRYQLNRFNNLRNAAASLSATRRREMHHRVSRILRR